MSTHFASTSPDEWEVWEATRRGRSDFRAFSATTPSPGKLRLVVLDYAERWPRDALLNLMRDLADLRSYRLRVLLIARSADAWWHNLLHDLHLMHYAATAVELGPLHGGFIEDRKKAFLAARDGFADALGVSDPEAITIPENLDSAEFGLMLSVHMAALVKVDAHLQGIERPDVSPDSLSIYLLNRERAYWASLRSAVDPAVSIDSSSMSQAVYVATLTGPLSYKNARTALLRAAVESSENFGKILKAHSLCYPPNHLARPNNSYNEPGMSTYLEPIYPDRLGEDFLALTTPGHAASYPADPWATEVVENLLVREGFEDSAGWTASALTVLIETAARWGHIAAGQLYPLLRSHPQLMLEAGNAALARLADLPDVDIDVLQALADYFPGRHINLDAGMARVTQRLADHLLDTLEDPAERARILHALGMRYLNAGFFEQGLGPTQEAVGLYKRLAEENPSRFNPLLANSFNLLGINLSRSGRHVEALQATNDAVALYSRLSLAEPDLYEAEYGRVLANSAARQASSPEQRLAAAEEAVRIGKRWAESFPERPVELAGALENLANTFSDLGRHEEAVATGEEAVKVRKQQVREAPEQYTPDLARATANLSRYLVRAKQSNDGAAKAREAVNLYRDLAKIDPRKYQALLASALSSLGILLSSVGPPAEQIDATHEAVSLYRVLSEGDSKNKPTLAQALCNLGIHLNAAGERAKAVVATTEAVDLYRELAGADSTQRPNLALALHNLGIHLAGIDLESEAVEACTEAVDLYRVLAEGDSRHKPALAQALCNLGVRLTAAGEGAKAVVATTEAVDLYRELAGADSTHRLNLALALRNLGVLLAGIDLESEAVEACTEAVDLYRVLAETDGSHRPMLAFALLQCGSLLFDAEQADQSLEAFEQAIDLYRALSDAEPLIYRPALAKTLAGLGRAFIEVGRTAEAEAVIEESKRLAGYDDVQ
ncbi:tetratricopeptide repeat protein [Streptomyces sp. NPDC060235]|uniref:tetratricopeptide repeat protein n=1 Tax=Streptomyces sp. NPDC060235 TaxID=3347080 RepID=UPI0036548594